MKVLVIDNFDSFTYNLIDELKKRECEVEVYRNNIDLNFIDKIIGEFKPKLLIISSGSGTPKDTGNVKEIILNYWQKIPILGINLGHLCIVEVFGGRVDKTNEIVHGQPAVIEHDNGTIFKDLENPFKAALFHSLAAVDVPYSLEISARSEKGVVMGVRHKESFVEGIQFIPDSILSPCGGKIIDNILRLAKRGK